MKSAFSVVSARAGGAIAELRSDAARNDRVFGISVSFSVWLCGAAVPSVASFGTGPAGTMRPIIGRSGAPGIDQDQPPAGLRLPSLVAPMPRVKACENAGPDRTAGCGLARDPSSIPGREGVRTRVFAGSRHGLCAETRP